MQYNYCNCENDAVAHTGNTRHFVFIDVMMKNSANIPQLCLSVPLTHVGTTDLAYSYQ